MQKWLKPTRKLRRTVLRQSRPEWTLALLKVLPGKWPLAVTSPRQAGRSSAGSESIAPSPAKRSGKTLSHRWSWPRVRNMFRCASADSRCAMAAGDVHAWRSKETASHFPLPSDSGDQYRGHSPAAASRFLIWLSVPTDVAEVGALCRQQESCSDRRFSGVERRAFLLYISHPYILSKSVPCCSIATITDSRAVCCVWL